MATFNQPSWYVERTAAVAVQQLPQIVAASPVLEFPKGAIALDFYQDDVKRVLAVFIDEAKAKQACMEWWAKGLEYSVRRTA